MRSQWHLSCESRLQGSWPAPSLTLGDRAGEERKKERQKNRNIGKDEKGLDNEKLSCDFESHRKPIKPVGWILLSPVYQRETEAQRG